MDLIEHHMEQQISENLTSPDHHNLEHYLCPNCELPIAELPLEKGKKALCPRCRTHLYRGGKFDAADNLALAIASLLFFIPSHFFPFISIRLLGVNIHATLPSGVLSLIDEGFLPLALLIFFCSSIAPFLLFSAVILNYCALKKRWFKMFKLSMSLIHHLRSWMMLDVFIVSIAISVFKLQDYATITMGIGLIGLIFLLFSAVLLIHRINIKSYWELWEKEASFAFAKKEMICLHCHLSQPESHQCARCKSPLHKRKPYSLQKTWAYLFTAIIAIFPANFLSISILLSNGQRFQDTIMSGVIALIHAHTYGIAAIIFIASIVVPIAKIVGLAYIAMCIQFKRTKLHQQRMIAYFIIHYVGKWSVMDLFVITIMMTLLDRGQLLAFTPGYGAVAFGIVVLFTMLAVESLDLRLIWDNYDEHQANTVNHHLSTHEHIDTE